MAETEVCVGDKAHTLPEEMMHLIEAIRGETAQIRATTGAAREILSHGSGDHYREIRTAALVTTLEALTSLTDLDAFLGVVLTRCCDCLHASSAALWLLNEARTEVTIHLSCEDGKVLAGASCDHPGGTTPTASALVRGWKELIESRKPVTADDFSTVPSPYGEWYRSHGIKTILVVPLIAADEAIGFIGLRSVHARHWLDVEIEFARSLAQQAAIAIHMNSLAMKRTEAELANERTRVAREIHDTLAQGLAGVIMQLEAAKHAYAHSKDETTHYLDDAVELARSCLAEARRSVWALRPDSLSKGSLSEAISHLMRQLCSSRHLSWNVAVRGEQRHLPDSVEAALLRIASEAVTNAVKHAHAKSIRTVITFRPTMVSVLVRDDGAGITSVEDALERGFGMLGMRERAESVKARLKVTSSPRTGTSIRVTVPASREEGMRIEY